MRKRIKGELFVLVQRAAILAADLTAFAYACSQVMRLFTPRLARTRERIRTHLRLLKGDES